MMDQTNGSNRQDSGRDRDDKAGSNDNSPMQWAGVGIEFFGVIAVLGYIGYRLDQLCNTSPWLMIILSFLGFTGTLYSIIRRAMKQ